MAKGKGEKKKKDKFDALGDEFKSAVLGSSIEDINKRIARTAKLDMEMREILLKDDAINGPTGAKAVLKNLMQPYRDDFKSFKLQMEFAKWAIDQKDGGASTAKAQEEESQS